VREEGGIAGLPRTAQEWRALLGRVRRVTRRSPDAEDMLQSAILRMHEYAKLHTVDNPTAFIVRTARNLSIDAARQAKFVSGLIVDARSELIADRSSIQDEVIAARIRLERVREAIQCLTPRTRTVFLMHRIDGLKYREIAAQLGITVSAVEKHIAKAAAHIAELAERPDNDAN
jgi:RNA polymerase sigma factor (sigma-70 family)